MKSIGFRRKIEVKDGTESGSGRLFQRSGRTIADFIYPPSCTTSSRNLLHGEFYVCTKCWNAFERVAPTETVIQSIEEKFLAEKEVDKIVSVFLFEQDPRVRTAIHLLKYSGAEAIADRLGIYISKKIADDEKLSTCNMVVPVPLHSARKRERGYNQSELIARRVGRELSIEHVPADFGNNLHTRPKQCSMQKGKGVHRGGICNGKAFHGCGCRQKYSFDRRCDNHRLDGKRMRESSERKRGGGSLCGIGSDNDMKS